MEKVIITKGIDMEILAANVSNVLEVRDLEVFMNKLNTLLSQKKSQPKQYRIEELNQLINETVLDIDKRIIFNTLNEKLLNETMTKDENRVFLKIAEEEAQLRNKRVEYMIKLSQLRGISLQKLMSEIGLKPLNNV
jgi:hypothetical protein